MLINFLLFLGGYLLIQLFYFFLAKKYSIVDRPNARSSHQSITIRGGGIVFPIAALLFLSFSNIDYVLFGLGLIAISILSFIDDVRNIDSKLRLVVQGLAVAAMVYPFLKTMDWYCFPILLVLVIGVINAYNFMDGINGITVLYSIVCMGTLYWINRQIVVLQSIDFFLSILAALLVFAFFNVRKRARCFAGDVGSVSMAFILCFLLIKLVVVTQWYGWILLLGVYGVDSVFTIVCRIFRKEPLMQAHRSHFYQYLANEVGIGHLAVSFLYGSLQLLMNFVVVYSFLQTSPLVAFVTLFAFLIIYTIFRFRLEGRKRLFVSYNPE